MSAPDAPRPGDYVVLYGNTRLELIVLLEDGGSRLVRATFESPEISGPRFEREACAGAAAFGSRAYRVVPGTAPRAITE